MWSHLNDIAAVCAGVGLAAGNNRFAALTERARRLNAALTGHRFLFGTRPRRRQRPRRSTPTRCAAAREELAALRAETRSAAGASCSSTPPSRTACPTSASSRADDAERLGAVGPAARAAGLAEDVRATSPRLAYDGFEPVVPERAAGDVQARLEQRALELLQSFELLDAPARRPGRAGRRRAAAARSARSASAASRARAARRAASSSATATAIERLRLRTGSYANWPVVAHAAADNLLPDFPLINKSFELCYACADR